MAGNSIDTNPQALRNAASSVRAYTACQQDIVSQYLIQMNSLYSDIEISGYQMCIEAIAAMKNRMDELRNEGEGFAQFLENRADMLDGIKAH